MSDFNKFYAKWFKRAGDLYDRKGGGGKAFIGVLFTLTSNNPEGIVSYASSPGINIFTESLLFYSHSPRTPPDETPSLVEESFSNSLYDLMVEPKLIFSKPPDYTPKVGYLFSNRRNGKLDSIVGEPGWGKADRRQLFDVAAADKLRLTVSIRGGGPIVVTGVTQSNYGEAEKRIFKFDADCIGEDMLYGLTNSTVYIISFNRLLDIFINI